MANAERGEVSFEASGKSWTMKIGTEAMCQIEDLTGKGIAEVGQLLGNEKTASITLLRAVFCGSLQEHHEGITPKECSKLMDEVGVDVIGQKIGEAFSVAFPTAKKGKDGASAVPPKAPTAG
jgi:hypothetical protein